MLNRISFWLFVASSLAVNGLGQNGGPTFTYISGPNFCLAEYGFTVAAFCTATGELPLASFPIPPIGGFYYDPNFGAKVRLLTDGTTDSIHQYSAPSAFSATGKYVLIGRMDGSYRVVDTATARIVADLSGISDPSSALWSATDDDVIYGIGCFPCGGSYSPTQIYKY